MQSRFVSYLDLMCCGFGGALLMFLIVASARERIESAEPMLVVRCHAETSESGTSLPGAELGIEYRKAGAKKWIRANGLPSSDDIVGTSQDGKNGAKWSFLPRTAPGQPAEAVMICRYPKPGVWEFRAYLADFPRHRPGENYPISVMFTCLGAVQNRSASSILLTPGGVTSVIALEVRATD